MRPRGRHSHFETTRWSLVCAVRAEDPSAAHRALTVLCSTYWYPLYAYVRGQGYDAEDARDLIQSFFVQLLERQDVQGVRQERGLFRSFLLAALRHFLLNDLVHRRALKRGGGHVLVPLEFENAEEKYVHEPVDAHTPETLFDRGWALAVLDQVFQHLRRDWEAEGSGSEFDRLKACLLGDLPPGGYRTIAAEIGSTEGAARAAVHRLRRDFQQRLREVIADTVLTDEAVADEIRHLFNALRG